MAIALLSGTDVTVSKSESNTDTSITTAYDSGSTGSGRMLVVAISYKSGSNATEANRKNVASITYNGDALTMRKRQLYTGSASTAKTNIDLWTLAAPDTGSNNLVVTWNNPTEASTHIISAMVLTGVSGVAAASVAANASVASADSITALNFTFNSATNFAVIAIALPYAGFGPIDGVSGWTVEHEDEQGTASGGNAIALGYYQTDAASSKTFTWSPGSGTGSSGQYQGVAIELAPSTGSISVDDATIDPHADTVVTITKSSAWNGAVSATIEGTTISLTNINTTQKSFTLDIDDLLPGGAWNAIRPATDATLAVTDSDGTFTTEVQIVFDSAIGEDYVNSPGANVGTYTAVPGAATGDPHFAFWHLGDGVRDKTISGTTDAGTGYFAPITMPSQGRLIAYDVSGAVWLAHVDTILFESATLDFSRTEYIPDAPESRNLLKWSNGFGNSVWVKHGSSTIAYGQTDSAGGSTAWLSTGNSASGLYQNVTLPIGLTVVPWFVVKAGTCSNLMLRDDSTDVNAVFSVSAGAGTVTSVSPGATAGIEAYGTVAGFYRIWISYVTTNATVRVWCRQNDGTGLTFIVDRAQVDVGRSTPAPYVHTEHVPLRSDQMIVRAQGAHNLVPYSNDLSNAAWTKTRSAAPGTSLALSGSASGGWAGATLYKFREDSTASATHSVQAADNSILLNPSGLVTARFVAASDGGQDRHVQINVYGDSYSNYFNYRVNLVTGAVLISAVTGTAALHSISVTQVDTVTIEGTGSCPVWEIVVRGWPTTTSDSAQQSLLFYVTDASGNVSYTGDGTSGIYLGKIQVVSGYDLPDYAETTAADPLFANVVNAATLNGVAQGVALDALIQHTEDQTQTTPWTRTNIHAVTAEGVSADGYPAYKIDCNTTDGNHMLGYATVQKTLTDSTPLTIFGDFRGDERSHVQFQIRNKAGTIISNFFNVTSGTEGTAVNSPADASIESRGDGWYRCRVVADLSTGGTTPAMRIVIGEADNDNSFAGLGDNDGLLVSRCFAVEGNVAMADADAAYVRAGSTMEFVRDRSSAIVTMPGIDEFDAAGDHVSTRWEIDQSFTLSDGTTTITDTIQLEPYVPANFGTIGSGTLVYAPTGAGPGDDCYCVVLTGTGTADPTTCSIVGNGTGTVMAYSVELGEWLDTRELSAFSGSAELLRRAYLSVSLGV